MNRQKPLAIEGGRRRMFVYFTSLAVTAFGIGSCQRDLVVTIAMVRDGEQGPLSPPTNVRGGSQAKIQGVPSRPLIVGWYNHATDCFFRSASATRPGSSPHNKVPAGTRAAIR
jgi:hypothetical protein